MSIASADIRDYFYRNAVNTWTAPNFNQDALHWKLSSTSAIISGDTKYQISENSLNGRIIIPSTLTTANHELIYVDGGITTALGEGLMKFSLSAINSDFGIGLRRAADDTFYIARISGGNSASVIVKTSSVAAPYLVQLGSASFTSVANVEYWMRFRTDTDNRLKMRVWRADAAEPTTWMVDVAAYTGSVMPASGNCGVWWRGSSTAVTATVKAFYGYQTPYEAESTAQFSIFTAGSSVDNGFGDTYFHQWRGALADEPESYGLTDTDVNAYVTSGDAFGTAVVQTTKEIWGFLGPPRADGYAELRITMPTTGMAASVALRATPVYSSGVPTLTGYSARLSTSDTFLRIYRISAGYAVVHLASVSIGTVPLNTQMVLSIGQVGNRILAKAAPYGTTVDWMISTYDTGTQVTGSGSGAVYLGNAGASTALTYQIKQLYVDDYYVIPWKGAAVLDASGTLTAVGQRTQKGAAALSATGTFGTGAPVTNKIASSGMFGTGTLVATALLQKAPQLAAAVLSGTGTLLSTSSTKISSAAAGLSATGTTVSQGSKLVSVGSTFSSTGTLSVGLETTKIGAAAFDANSNLTGDSYKEKSSGAILTAVAGISVVPSVERSAVASLSATGTIKANPNEFTIELIGSFNLVSNGAARYLASAFLEASADMSANSRVAFTQNAEAYLDAIGTMTAGSSAQITGSSQLIGTTDFEVATQRNVSGQSILSTTGSLTITLLDFAALYDSNMRYRTDLLHKLCKRLYPRHTSIMLKHVDTSLTTTSSPFVVVQDGYAVGYGTATTQWGHDLLLNPTTVIFVTGIASVEYEISQFPVKIRREG